MKWFKNMRISAKLISSFILVSLIAGIMGTVGIYNMWKVDKEYKGLYEDYGVSLGDLGSAGIDFNRNRYRLANMLLNDDQAEKERLANEIRDIENQISLNLEEFGGTIRSEENRRKFQELQQKFEMFKTSRDRVMDLALSGRNGQAIELLNTETAVLASAANDALMEMFDLRKTNGGKLSRQLSEQTNSSMISMVVTVIVMVVVSIILGVLVSRMISKPVNKLVASANQIADGDLNVIVEVESRDEVGQLALAFRKMSDNLNEIMGNIQIAADQVASGAKQISDLSVSMSQGATEQASSVEQLTASIEEIDSQTRQNAQTSNEANEIAEAAKQNALLGNNQMKEMLSAMDEINDASQNISKIIKVIDEIAFQTNILALNAAVEAARAGQHGKGFAVVAEEVRNLAARSANAARETTELIEGSIRKVEEGTKIAQETANALQSIVDDVARVSELISNIATASNEQAIGISQINQGIMQVSQVVQTTSANLEEGATTSEELSAQANLLQEQVNRFQLRKTKTGSGSSLDELSPELMELFEKMSRNKGNVPPVSEAKAAAAQQTKIDLNDYEFGKY